MELTVESLIGELGLDLVSGEEAARTHVRWVHSTELPDPTPWLKGGELLLTTGIQLTGPKLQRELIDRLADHEIAGLGFGTGFAHRRLPAALVTAARKRGFPLFEVPYELPFIAITERAFAQLLDERYELLQRNMVGDLLAEALSGHLYPEDLQARLRPFGIGEQVAVLAFSAPDPSPAAASVERIARSASAFRAWWRSAQGWCARSWTPAARTRWSSRGVIRSGARAALRRGPGGRQPARPRPTRCA